MSDSEQHKEAGHLAKIRSKEWMNHGRAAEAMTARNMAKDHGHRASEKKRDMAKKMKSGSGYNNPFSDSAPPRSRTSDAAAGGTNR